MELKVWVEGIQRIVCGVTETTTCQDVVFALAHATGKSGRFTLIERWRNNERQLAPNENPLKLLMKWGEYSNDVQFILQWNESNKNTSSNTSTNKNKSQSSGTQSLKNLNITVDLPLKNDSPKSPHHIGNQSSDNIGVVKGVPHVRSNELEVRDQPNYNSPTKQKQQKLDTILTSSNNSSCSSNSNCNESSPSHRVAPPYKDPPAPPPYRDPPPPNSNSNSNTNMKKSFSPKDKNDNRNNKLQDSMLFNAQYRELIALINYQREKLSNQQADLTKFDAEIVFWESKEREKQMQLDYITQELNAVSNINKINQDQIQALIYIEEESEIVKQQEKTLKSEITLLRSKLANCETELLQCKNKIRLLLDELQIEQRAQSRRTESKKHIERNLLVEMERIHHDIELAKQSTELHHLTAENLKKEVAALEQAIIEKKKQVELLVTEMKEANLQSLTIAPPEDLRAIFEGPNKSGSTRKMIGSPRQLENAVPTNKNPHGVWV